MIRDRPTTRWIKGHLVWSLGNNIILGYVFTWNHGKGSADEVNYSDAFAMANKHAIIEQIAGDGAYGCDMCLADTVSAGVKPYFPLEASWNPKTKKHMSVADATKYKRYYEDHYAEWKAVYDYRNLAECGNKVLKEVTDGYLWTRPTRRSKATSEGEPEQLELEVGPNIRGKKQPKSKPGYITDKITPEELERIRLKAREIGTGNLNECLLKLTLMNLRGIIRAEEMYDEKVDFFDPNFRFGQIKYDKAS